jgi:hypothetical protein
LKEKEEKDKKEDEGPRFGCFGCCCSRFMFVCVDCSVFQARKKDKEAAENGGICLTE